MKHIHRLLVATLAAVAVLLAGCQKPLEAHHPEPPSEVTRVDGSEFSHVTLTEKAMQRLDLKTEQVREMRVSGFSSPRRVVPYSALIYDPQGQTWVYTSPRPRTFVRQRVDVDTIDGDLVVLKDGPPAGTIVASVGVAELYGTEFKVGH